MDKYNKQFSKKSESELSNTKNMKTVNALTSKSHPLHKFANSESSLTCTKRPVPKELSNDEASWIEVIDINFKARDEDKVYKTNNEIRDKIRRGNTILYVKKWDGEDRDMCIIARKGLNKFFDYSPAFQIKPSSMSSVVIGKVLDYLKEDNKYSISIFETYKANGENVQISYNETISAWFVCSKNLAMLYRNESDLDQYRVNTEISTLYSYCLRFADQWNQYLSKLSEDELKELMEALNGYTLVGESVGTENQHIKLYNSPHFQFYALINNNSLQPCEEIESTEAFCKKFKLKMVEFNIVSGISTKEAFFGAMEKLYNNVLFSSIDEKGEGSVCYFTVYNESTKNHEVLSLAKLKTFEYRFIRKLREKLKGRIEKGSISTTLKAIENESISILGEQISFVGLMKFAAFVISHVVQKQIKINFQQFATFIDNELQLFKQLNSSIDLKIKNESMQEDLIFMEGLIEAQTDVKFQEESNNEVSNSKKINPLKTDYPYLLINFGLVGGGKSTLYSILSKIIVSSEKLKSNINLKYVSSDEINAKLISEYQAKYPKLSSDEIFPKIREKGSKLFKEKVSEFIGSHKKGQLTFIYLDKNFPLGDFDVNLHLKKERFNTIYFYPKIQNPLGGQCEFSAEYIMQCYDRIKNRDHSTLNLELNAEFYIILFHFIKLNKSKNFLKKCNSSSNCFEITMTDEETQVELDDSEQFKRSILKIINYSDRQFDTDLLKECCEREIKYLVTTIEKAVESHKFKSTVDVIEKELNSCKFAYFF